MFGDFALFIVLRMLSVNVVSIGCYTMHSSSPGSSGFLVNTLWSSHSSVFPNSVCFTRHLVFKLMIKLVPTPSSDLTSTEPPICSIIFLQIDNPSPVPDLFRLLFSCNLLKSINRFLIPSSEMPIPVSIIDIWRWIYCCAPILTSFSTACRLY